METWTSVILGIGLLLSIVAAAIQIGALRSQIIINTGRLAKLEEFMDAAREHIANTNAKWPDIERWIGRLESILNHITIKLDHTK